MTGLFPCPSRKVLSCEHPPRRRRGNSVKSGMSVTSDAAQNHGLGRRRARPALGFVFQPYDANWQMWLLVGVAGFSVGVAAGSFENLVRLLYGMTRQRTREDEELCSSCTGFGTVRCMVCYGTGTVAHTVGRKITQRQCSACNGSKRERYEIGVRDDTTLASFCCYRLDNWRLSCRSS